MRQALAQGRLNDAGDILSRLKREDPLSRETRGLELEFYLKGNRLEEAGSLAEQLMNLFPDSGRILYLAGKVAYRQKQYETAESRFRESQRVYPHRQTRHWLGKTLTQLGRFDEAEATLLSVRDQARHASLDLAWLYERKGDLESALKALEEYLQVYPGHPYATEQRLRIKAKMLEPEALVEEVDALAEWGGQVSDGLFPEFVQRLFEMGEGPRAREEIQGRLEGQGDRVGTRLAWVCYRAQAYDLACALFLKHLAANVSNFKYLSALETAAIKSHRLSVVVDAYDALAPQSPQLYGRSKSLSRRAEKR